MGEMRVVAPVPGAWSCKGSSQACGSLQRWLS